MEDSAHYHVCGDEWRTGGATLNIVYPSFPAAATVHKRRVMYQSGFNLMEKD